MGFYQWAKEVEELPINLQRPKVFITTSLGLARVMHPIIPDVLKFYVCDLLHITAQRLDMLLEVSLGVGREGAMVSSIFSLLPHLKAMPLSGEFRGHTGRIAQSHCKSRKSRGRMYMVAERKVWARGVVMQWVKG